MVLFFVFSTPSIYAPSLFLCFVSVSSIFFFPKPLLCSSLFPINNSPVPSIFFLCLFVPSLFFVVLCFLFSKLSMFVSSLYTFLPFFSPPLFSSLPLGIYRQRERGSLCPILSWCRVRWCGVAPAFAEHYFPFLLVW